MCGSETKIKLNVHKINSIDPYAEKGVEGQNNKNKKLASTLYGKLNSTSKIKSTSKINSFKNKANQLKRFSSDRRKKKKTQPKKKRTLKFYKLKQKKKINRQRIKLR